jgi:hypothetical protein
MSGAHQLTVELSFDDAAASTFVEGYLAGVDDSVDGNPLLHADLDEEFFSEYLAQFAAVETPQPDR